MIHDKKIVMIGVSDEDAMELRLLLHKARPQLQHTWEWSIEANADLVIVDRSNMEGKMGWMRMKTGGRHCAVLGENIEEASDADILLAKPLNLKDFLKVLRHLETETYLEASFIPQNEGVSYTDIVSLELEKGESDSLRLRAVGEAPEPVGLEDFLAFHKPNVPDPAKKTLGNKNNLPSNQWSVVLTPKVAASTFSALDIAATPIHFHSEKVSAELNMDPVATTPRYRVHGINRRETHTLVEYLQGDFLGAPARFMLADSPELIVDPKFRLYYADNHSLKALQNYFLSPLQCDKWRSLTTKELTKVRSEMPPRSYKRLIWLNAMIHSGGRLADHLDPGGKYTLTQEVEAEEEFPFHEQIAKAMQQPARLNEITAESGRSMEEVIDFINACDAIGNIQMERRPPRHADPKNSGLFGFLRRSFGMAR